ncbi:MAG: DUF4147 domain-containing protein, partial [Pseudomonadota bacterium]
LFAAFQAGVAAADPERAVSAALAAHPPALPARGGTLIAVGKAARKMTAAAMAATGPWDGPPIVVTNPENAAPLDGARVFTAGHPVPDAGGQRAAEAVMARLDAAGPGDCIVALISGGASALLPAPAPGLTLADKIALNDLLLASGLDIGAMNLVRQHLSVLKGGGFLRRAQPARVVSYILSDVIGDDLRIVGSGPTVGPVGPKSAARRLLQDTGLWPQLSAPVQNVLAGSDTTDPLPETETHLIGSNTQSVAAMAEAVGARISPTPLTGDVGAAATRILDEAAQLAPGDTLAFGGETTVEVTGSGLGGRNQELSLRVAIAAEARGFPRPWTFLSGGTDGRDGPTDAAGGIVDADTLSRMRSTGIDPHAALADNASNAALAGAGDLLITGPTGTNVADLQLFCRG